MIPQWAYLDEHDRAVVRATVAFLNKRLAEPGTIDWALKLKPNQRIERIAVGDLLDNLSVRAVSEPWATAWRLIEESWSSPTNEEGPSIAIYDIQRRLRAGDRSGTIVAAIVNLVAPRLKLEPSGSRPWQLVEKARRPKTFNDLLSTSLTSGELIDLNILELAALPEVPFLKALASALEAAVDYGLDIARRIGWDGHRRLWELGGLERVYYVDPTVPTSGSSDPDSYHNGIAPSVKLLHTVVAQIADLEATAALPFVQRWRFASSPVYIRLWAATARSPKLVTAQDVGAFLCSLDDRHYWELDVFPEIAELRALRFGDFDPETQKAIAQRIRKGPPRDHWPRNANAAKVKNARLYWAVRELKRIDVAGGNLPQDTWKWMEATITRFPELRAMTLDNGFPQATEAHCVPPSPDFTYDTLDGVNRLRVLETALSTGGNGWYDDRAERANDWLRIPEKSALVLSDFESTSNGGDGFPQVWNSFGWASSPAEPQAAEISQSDLQLEADRVLALLKMLCENTLSVAIKGVSHWLDAWSKQVVASPYGLSVWQRVWPIAVEATNANQQAEDDADLSVSARAADNNQEPMDLDTLNTPAGKLVGVFLSSCPPLDRVPHPFAAGSSARQIRDATIGASGRSGLIARHRLIERLPYFLRADRDWAREHLITPLLSDADASLALWRAVARRTHSTNVLKIIGAAMAERATDRRLGRKTRGRLVFSLVVESMHAFRENREPAVPNPRIQQMLRSLDDEVRAAAANVIQQFVRDLSKRRPAEGNPLSAADLFRSAAAPFLRDVWPQERSLATSEVSRALSGLPAASGDAFAEAVEAIDRFLVPIECWSMVNYWLHGQDGETKRLTIINDEAKAKALLCLLDLTIGSSDGAVIPRDLSDALDQIRTVAPGLAENPVFRRLSTAARR